MILLFVLFVLLGFVMAGKPALTWMITESWKSTDATEPSEIYVLSTRFGGVIFILLGLAGIYVYGFMN